MGHGQAEAVGVLRPRILLARQKVPHSRGGCNAAIGEIEMHIRDILIPGMLTGRVAEILKGHRL
jgi:hypothetical protein